MVSVDAADAEDIKHLVTQLLLQVLPTSTAELQLREQAGCDLWDMTRAEGPARIAVQHAALEILPKVAMEALSHNQPRMAELLTGALANILCHSTLAEQVSRDSCSANTVKEVHTHHPLN